MSDRAFFTIHSGLKREGPGGPDSLNAALRVAAPPRNARILDAGCGPGPDIATLLDHAPEGHVMALDLHADFIERVAAAWAGDDRVTARQGDMADPGGPYDLIWSAGAIYQLGITPTLQAWRAALAPGGKVAFTDIAWRRPDPSPEARAFWQSYPAMTDAEGIAAQVRAAGFRLVHQAFVPDSEWEAYYAPLARRVAQLRAEGPDADLAQELDETEREIALWRDHGSDYGYLCCVVVPE
ncbi:class I SAM-dependent methyltransferase [Plastorhodobacter daqingensis]|uniref:Class I SAM-dependent methyltransferase n=1 Tax=Plastorhodobacter daqingensis TaxID=1387281 RepID=A0ABW2UQ08_9RHOB